jgi:hypothetical protein
MFPTRNLIVYLWLLELVICGFTPINSFSGYYNLEPCAQDCLADPSIGVQAALHCSNANCACTQFNNGMTYASSCAVAKCTTSAAEVQAATQCWAAFCTSAAAELKFTLEALTTPTSNRNFSNSYTRKKLNC